VEEILKPSVPITTEVPATAPEKPKTAAASDAKAGYSGITVKKGVIGQLKKPKHVGAKIRARDRGKITRERQMERKTKRKETIRKLSVNIKKEKGQKTGQKPQTSNKKDDAFDKLVSNYKSKISAGLKLL